MPNFNLHKRFGYIASLLFTAIFASIFLPNLSISLILLAIPVVWFFSNLPDIDHHISRIRKYTFMFIFICLAISSVVMAFIGYGYAMVLLTIIGILGIYVLKLKHRGMTHNYFFIMFASLPLLFFHWFLFRLAFIAGSSHIFVDRFWSSSKRKVKKILGIRSNYHVYVRI